MWKLISIFIVAISLNAQPSGGGPGVSPNLSSCATTPPTTGTFGQQCIGSDHTTYTCPVTSCVAGSDWTTAGADPPLALQALINNAYTGGITFLIAGHQELTGLPPGVFDYLGGLTSIFLNSNALTSLPSGLFDHNTLATYIYLNNNALTSLPAGLFDHNTAVERIYLNNNALTSLPSDLFDNNTALSILQLNGNALTSPPVLTANTVLTILSLCDTPGTFTAIPNNYFAHNPLLTTIDFSATCSLG